MKDYTEEQKDLLEKPVITIMPAFNNEWVIEVTDYTGELQGRFNAETGEIAIQAIESALCGERPDFGRN